MKIKEIIWKDNITDLGKQKGFLELKYSNYDIALKFIIRNYDVSKDNQVIENKYFLCINNYKPLEFETIDEAKIKAKEYNEAKIFRKFFTDDSTSDIEHKDIENCPLCGTKCEVLGNTTKHYSPIKKN